MIIKEKTVFFSLIIALIGIAAFGFASGDKRREAGEELIEDIKAATEKTRAGKKISKDSWDVDKLKSEDTLDGYKLLLARSPFFRQGSDKNVKQAEIIPVKKELPKPKFKYKGKVKMGTKVMVIIGDEATGKSFFAAEGDYVGDFLVSEVNEKEVKLRKTGGEEIVLNALKKEKETVDEKKVLETKD
jgi:hypothetical protein